MKVVVVGAGLTGLTVAGELAAAGATVTVVERAPAVGGLARTFRYGSGFFDVGPHRFHVEDEGVRRWIAGVLPGELRELPRRSAVHAFGRLHEWPLRPHVLASVPLRVLLRAAADLVRRRPVAGESFEAEMLARYGETLYAAFFGPYTHRFSGVAPALLHRDWGRAGLDRAAIDRRVRVAGLLDLLRGALSPRRLETTFQYPDQGIGRLAERLAERVRRAGGAVLLGRVVDGIEVSGPRVRAVRAAGEELPLDALVWTGTLTGAARLVGADGRGLSFRSTVLFNVSTRRPTRSRDQWVYFAEEPAFVRVSWPTAFSNTAAAPGRGALCVERTCTEGDATWERAAELVPEVVGALARYGLLASAADVEEVHVERVADTYPIYTLGYVAARDACLEELGRLENLLPAGRCGRFWYNNMDHSIAQGLRIARQLVDGRPPARVDVGALEFWRPQGA